MYSIGQVRAFLRRFFDDLWGLVSQHALSLAIWTSLALSLILAVREFGAMRSASVRFLGGPRAGLSAQEAQKIVVNLNRGTEWYLFDRSIGAEAFFTDGFLDNYRRIANDRQGKSVGFSLDGLHEPGPSQVQVLLPLEASFVHFVCRKDFLDDCYRIEKIAEIPEIYEALESRRMRSLEGLAAALRARRPYDQPYAISRVANALQDARRLLARLSNEQLSGMDVVDLPNLQAAKALADRVRQARFYMGPTYSGTRVLANAILAHLRIDTNLRRAIGVVDFSEMRVALLDKKIVGGFLVSKPDSTTISSIASDGKCSLVSIDNAEAIKASGAFVRPAEFAEMHYHKGDRHFCPGTTMTIETRRVLVASSEMPADIACRVGQAAIEVFGINPSEIRWTNVQREQPLGLSYDLHAGAKRLSGQTSGVVSWVLRNPLVQLVGPALLAGFLLELLAPLQTVISRLNQRSQQSSK